MKLADAVRDGPTAIGPVSGDGEAAISTEFPYAVEVAIEGTAPILFHRWSNEAVEAKAKAAKNSREKKSDNLESYVYRMPSGNLGVPGEYLRMAGVNAARFHQDPRSPRKSMLDLFKAAVVSLTELADLGCRDWDYEDRRRVVVQRNAITRARPALREGWRATFLLQVLMPEYVSPMVLHQVLTQAGRLVGIGDFRPTYGRFALTGYRVLSE